MQKRNIHIAIAALVLFVGVAAGIHLLRKDARADEPVTVNVFVWTWLPEPDSIQVPVTDLGVQVRFRVNWGDWSVWDDTVEILDGFYRQSSEPVPLTDAVEWQARINLFDGELVMPNAQIAMDPPLNARTYPYMDWQVIP